MVRTTSAILDNWEGSNASLSSNLGIDNQCILQHLKKHKRLCALKFHTFSQNEVLKSHTDKIVKTGTEGIMNDIAKESSTHHFGPGSPLPCSPETKNRASPSSSQD